MTANEIRRRQGWTRSRAAARQATATLLKQPDLALVDIDLRSGIDGIAVARQLRAWHGTSSVFLTGQLEAVRSAGDAVAGIT